VPSSQFGGGSKALYVGIIAVGALGLGLLVPWLFYTFRKPSWKLPDTVDAAGAAATTGE